MSTTTGTTSTTGTNAYSFLNGSTATTVSAAKEQSDRFLKLLTTQLKNQDPLNPMDNAQMTSQMAQISTVSGIETLNASMQAMGTQFVQLQALQGAGMVGRDVLLPGNQLAISTVDGSATGKGSFDIASAASSVNVDILNGSGVVVDTLKLGAQDKGRHDFSWPAGDVTDQAGYTFKVTATSGNTALTATALMRDRVDAVNTGDKTLTLELQRSGAVDYSTIKALN
jgi:flagellar basal-body rod modification protein FlgD